MFALLSRSDASVWDTEQQSIHNRRYLSCTGSHRIATRHWISETLVHPFTDHLTK